MAQATQTMRFTLVLALAAAVIVAGGLTIGFAQTLTLLALASTLLVFYLMIHISAN